MAKIVHSFLLAYRTTPKSSLPQQHCSPGLFFGRKPRMTHLPTKQKTGSDLKIKRQFSDRHGAVARNIDGADPVCVRYRRSNDWKGGSVAKKIGDCLYDLMLADWSTRRFHVNQMQLASTHLTDDFTAFITLSTCPFEARKLSPEELDTWTNMQWTTTNRPVSRELQLWTTSNRSSQATRCQNPAVLIKVTFERNNLSWT